MPGFAKNNPHSIHGTLRFEAILPNISLKIKQIELKPIASSKLSINLLNHENKNDICPQIGYLTLSESGFLVPLLENDFDVLTVPIVGVWTRFNSDDNNDNKNNNNNNDNNDNDINHKNNDNKNNDYNNNDNDTNNDYNNTNDIGNQTNKNYKSNKNNHDNNHNIKNPLTWAICVRFIYSKHIKDKLYAPDGSFLLVFDKYIL